MITAPSVGDQTIQVQAQTYVSDWLDTSNVNQDFESLGIFEEGSGLLDADSEIAPQELPPKTHLAVGSSPTRIPDGPPELDEQPKFEGHPLVQHRYRSQNDEDLIQEIQEKITPEFALNIEDTIQNDVLNKMGPIRSIEDDIERDADGLLEDIYPEGKDDLQHTKWYEYAYYFRWLVNFIFFASPWFMFSIAMVVLNIVLNILMNKWWAGGNWVLIFNTFYLILQTVMSWPLIFELPFYLTHLRFFRFFSVGLAWIYSLYYGFVLTDWIFQLYWEPESSYENYQFLDVMVNMFLAYNIMFNIHILPVNCAIITKEIFLEIFPPLLKQDRGTNLDVQDVEDVVKPRTYIDFVTRGQLPDEEGHKNDYTDDRFTHHPK